MRKIRVFHLIKGLNRGGAETLLVEGMRFADQERFDVSHGFFHPGLNALVPALAERSSSVTCFGGRHHMGMLRRVRAVARHLRANQIDLLHCHLPTAGAVGRLAGQLAGVPVVYTEHNKPERYRKPTFLLNAWTYGLQEQVIAVSSSVERSIRAHIGTRVPTVVVRNGIDCTHFRPLVRDGDVVRKMLGIPPDANVIGNIAALIPQKCLHDWLIAARMIHARHPAAHFILVGDGPQRVDLLHRIADFGLEEVVHLCGNHADVRPYLAATNIYMMSSAYEGLPVALLEAMAMQCVPVCTSVGGITEVIREGQNGFLTDPGMPEQLAERVLDLAGQPLRVRQLAASARETVEAEFRIDRMMRELEAVYLDVLARRLPRGRLESERNVARVS